MVEEIGRLFTDMKSVDLLHGKDRKKKMEFTYLITEKGILEIKNVYKLESVENTRIFNLIIGGVKCSLKIYEKKSLSDLVIVDTKEARYIVHVEINVKMEGYCQEYREVVSHLTSLPVTNEGYTRLDTREENLIFSKYKY
ncbi:MAG: hypothetical protein Hyperionvirus5_48 [Hyperionvirus sp.]|uniref:Uncharacterized protein n=1 Tax=Hyperionvirus sp. TaxID=2487770 RepID=A0A3G5A854_9VIRU|nr:MAG: hypothetical protein Hyperionvirus5_48 [Hyperionvirus sp.]